MRTIQTENLIWIDINDPSPKDVQNLKDNFSLHPLVSEKILPPSYRSKAEDYEDQLYLVLYFPVYDKESRQTKTRELDIIISKDVLITSHYLSILPVKEIFTKCSLYKEQRGKYFSRGPAILLYHIIEALIKACLPKLDNIAKKIEKVEEEIFKGKEKEMVNEISLIKRDILNMSKAIKPQQNILKSLASEAPNFFGRKTKLYFQDLLSSHEYTKSILENHQEMINSLESTNESLLSNKLSEIMRVLTVVSFITFPLAVIAGLFGMNVFEEVDYNSHPYTFFIILGAMILLSIIMAAIFRKKKWL